jgi:hypothetical protein
MVREASKGARAMTFEIDDETYTAAFGKKQDHDLDTLRIECGKLLAENAILKTQLADALQCARMERNMRREFSATLGKVPAIYHRAGLKDE